MHAWSIKNGHLQHLVFTEDTSMVSLGDALKTQAPRCLGYIVEYVGETASPATASPAPIQDDDLSATPTQRTRKAGAKKNR